MYISIPVTYHFLSIDRAFVANADREELLDAFRQTFDELGLRIHKQNSSILVHWPGGLGRATKVAAIMTNTPESFYRLTLESLGVPGYTAIQIAIKLVYGRWFHGREKAQAKIDAFLQKLVAVTSERKIWFVDRKQFNAQLKKANTAL